MRFFISKYCSRKMRERTVPQLPPTECVVAKGTLSIVLLTMIVDDQYGLCLRSGSKGLRDARVTSDIWF